MASPRARRTKPINNNSQSSTPVSTPLTIVPSPKYITSPEEIQAPESDANFKRYSPEILTSLKEIAPLFDQSGMSIIHYKCLADARDGSAQKMVLRDLNELRYRHGIPTNKKILLLKIIKGIENLTERQNAQICSCLSKESWKMKSEIQRQIFNKVSLGQNVTSAELYNMNKKTKPSKNEIPCFFKALNLYEEGQRVFGLP